MEFVSENVTSRNQKKIGTIHLRYNYTEMEAQLNTIQPSTVNLTNEET